MTYTAQSFPELIKQYDLARIPAELRRPAPPDPVPVRRGGRKMDRLPGESRIEQCRRNGIYEHYRADFEQWIWDENRSHGWISCRIGKSKATVQLIGAVLQIYTRAQRRTRAEMERDEEVRQQTREAMLDVLIETRKNEPPKRFHAKAPGIELVPLIRKYTAAWDRGW